MRTALAEGMPVTGAVSLWHPLRLSRYSDRPSQVEIMRLDTARKLYEHHHRIAAGCLDCQRWHEFSFIELDRLGLADRKALTLKFRCRECGRLGAAQVRSSYSGIGGVYRY